jgi:sigma-B regulation protein RsbU (phosphoserine phosphatase)
MTAAAANFIISLIDDTCILMVVVYCIIRTPFFYPILKDRAKPWKQLILTLFFGAVSSYGVLIADLTDHTIISISMIGPIAGAMIGGIRVGAGAGLAGAALGFYVNGTASQAAVLLAGIMAGLYRLRKKDNPVSAANAAVFTAGYEIFVHIVLFFFDQARPQINTFIPATALVSILGVAGFVFIFEKLVEERQTSASKELIESELRIASDIQMGIVPKTFPPFPNLPEIELYAVLKPAREVGGDLYDFFLIDCDHFFFAIGDVSGKGMPAALFMAVTRTLLKANAEPGISPDITLKRVNDVLCRGNDASMFVTVFCGILNIRTGEVVYSNAGHNPPYVYRSNGILETVRMPEGMALGVMEDISYGQDRLVLGRGDAMIAYTDGVSEAMDISFNQYSTERLEKTIETGATTESRGIIRHIMEDVERFAAGAEQSDDITILSLTYTPEPQR